MAELSRTIKLFLDWYKAQSPSQAKKISSMLEEATLKGSKFQEILSEMGTDGKTVKIMLEEQYGTLNVEAKKEVAKCLLEAKNGVVETEVGTYYFPVTDRSNALVNVIDPNDRDMVIQIRQAITGGNYSIAEELIKNSWSSLTLKDRLGLIEWVQNMDYYNRDSGVPKSGYTRMAQVKKETQAKTITKDKFAEKVLQTAKDQLRIK